MQCSSRCSEVAPVQDETYRNMQMREQAKVSALERQNRLAEERHHKSMQEMKQMVSDQEGMCDK